MDEIVAQVCKALTMTPISYDPGKLGIVADFGNTVVFLNAESK